jgi:CBS domain-containing protein
MPNTGSVSDGLAIMNEWWVRSVPVVDDKRHFVGNLSFYAVMATIQNLLASRVTAGIGEATVHHGLTLVDFTGLNMSAPMICHTGDPVDVAVHQMRARGVGSILVTDDRENLVGELTEFDLQTKIGCTSADLSTMKIEDVMQSSPASLPVRSSIADGLDQLLSGSVSHVPLIAESGKPVGVASVRDIAHYIDTTLETLG